MATKNIPPNHTGKTYKTNKIDPRSIEFKKHYLNSHNSVTFCNIYQSGIASGYSEEYSSNISARINKPKWWVEFSEQGDFLRASMLQTAQRNIQTTLQSHDDDRDSQKLKHDASKFVSERLGKEHYSTRQEVTGADGRRLFTNEKRVDATIPLTNLFKGVASSK